MQLQEQFHVQRGVVNLTGAERPPRSDPGSDLRNRR